MLDIVIVGAGIAGLGAAISLRRAGHRVRLFERSALDNEVGAAINVPPNTVRFLVAWGLDPQRWGFVRARPLVYLDPLTLATKTVLWTDEPPSAFGGADLYFAHRVDLHCALRWMATRDDGPGMPVTIHPRSNVVGYAVCLIYHVACLYLQDPMKPSILLEAGEEICADVVVGCKNQPVAPRHFNCCYRFLIPADMLDEDPETRFWNEGSRGLLRIMAHNETLRRLVTYKCRDNTIHNFIGIFHDDEGRSEKGENWQATADVSQVLGLFSDYHPKLLKVISKATDFKRWPLLYRPPLPTWTRGRMTLAGDATHPMLPHHAQGGAQALEDGLILGIVLHGASTPAKIETRLAIYARVRRRRASAIQVLSNVGQDQMELVRDDLRPYMADDEIPTCPAEAYRHNFGYDVVRASLAAMTEFDPGYRLPPDFFESDVVGVPTSAKAADRVPDSRTRILKLVATRSTRVSVGERD